MQRWFIAAFSVLAFGGNIAHASQPRPPWTGDYAAAKAEARQMGKPLLVVFRCVP